MNGKNVGELGKTCDSDCRIAFIQLFRKLEVGRQFVG
jgi:hypothetical protein